MSGFKDLDLRRKIVSVPIFTPRSFFLGRYFFFISRFLCSSSKSQIFQIISSVEKCVGPFWNNLRQLLKHLAADIWRKGGLVQRSAGSIESRESGFESWLIFQLNAVIKKQNTDRESYLLDAVYGF